jgi:hypothetical protein
MTVFCEGVAAPHTTSFLGSRTWEEQGMDFIWSLAQVLRSMVEPARGCNPGWYRYRPWGLRDTHDKVKVPGHGESYMKIVEFKY